MASAPSLHESTRETSLSRAPVTARPAEPYKLLIVEDDADLRLLLRLALHTEAYEIYEVADGQAALAMSLDLKPDVVLLDIALPGLDGISVLQQIRSVNATMRIIMVSALNTQPWIYAALTHGADGFMAKPLNITTLRHLVAQQMQRDRH